VKLNRVSLMVEDNLYLLKLCAPLRKRVACEQQEPVRSLDGLVDSRWEWTIKALEQHNGLTVKLESITTMFKRAVGDGATSTRGAFKATSTLGAFKAQVQSNAWLKLDWWEALFFDSIEKRARSRKGSSKGRGKGRCVVEQREKDLSAVVSLHEVLKSYSGPRTLPQMDVITSELADAQMPSERLAELAAASQDAWEKSDSASSTSKTKKLPGIDPPPMFAEAKKLTAVKVPGLLYDQRDVQLRMRSDVFEALGVFHVRPFLHFLELRRDCIFFEAYPAIRTHLSTNRILIIAAEDEAVLNIDDVREKDERFGCGLEFAMGHARQLEEWGARTLGLQPQTSLARAWPKSPTHCTGLKFAPHCG
jgi:hypothetical protein